MRKIFLTSGLVLCMACPAFADLTAPYTGHNNGVVSGTENSQNPVDPTCQQPTLEGYSGTSTFTAIWTKNKYNVTYAPGAHGTGGQTITDAAEYDTNYTIRGLGSNTATASGVTANTGYTFLDWAGTSVDHGNGADATYNATNHTYDETDSINPYQIAGDLTLTAEWRHNTATITLNSSIYTANTISGNPKYNQDTEADGITKANPSTVYSGYNIGLFSSQLDATEGNPDLIYDNENPVIIPSRTGYDFKGFYDLSSNQMIDNHGVPTNAADTAVSQDGGSATWYAHWDAQDVTIHYTCGTVPSGASTGTPGNAVGGTAPTDSSNLKYDGAYSLSQGAGSCALNGYHFVGWSCNKNLDTGATGASVNYNATCGTGSVDNLNTCTVSQSGQAAKWTGTVTCDAKWAPNTIGTTWDLQDGSATTAGGATCTYEGAITLPQGVTKTGYTFGGWTVTSSNPSNQ